MRETLPPHLTSPHLVKQRLGLPRVRRVETLDQPPEGDACLHEIKLGGYRTAARIEGSKVRLQTRTGLDWTVRFGPITAALHKAFFDIVSGAAPDTYNWLTPVKVRETVTA